MTARNHHFVPQCYLKGFARHRNKPKVFVVDRQSRDTFYANPSNIAVERDFHTIDVEGVAPDALEASFSQFETRLAPALVQIINDRIITKEDDKAHLINLVAMLSVKNPMRRQWLMDFDNDIFDRVLDHVLQNDNSFDHEVRKAKEVGFITENTEPNRNQIREFLDRQEYSIDVDRGRYIKIELKLFENVLQHCSHRAWTLIRAPKDSSGFITSDNPVCLRWSNPEMSKGPYSPGHGLKGTEVLFPISSELAWIGTFEHPVRTVDISEDTVRDINGTILTSSYRQIYGRDGDCGYRLQPGDKPRRICELPKDTRFPVRKDQKTRVRIARESLRR